MKFFSVKLILLVLLSFYPFVFTQRNSNDTKNVERILELSTSTPWDIIKSYNYPVENHNVTTEDGYILSIQRIPHGKSHKKSSKPPILLVTGIFSNSLMWIIDEKYLAYKLADLGHDIWLLNNRGSEYNKEHRYFKPDSNNYWNFSFHEMGIYDVPNTIDYILEKTKYKSLYCIGYSQGGTALSIMLAKLPDYNAKVRLVTYFAPAVYLKHILYAVQVLAKGSFYKNAMEFVAKYGYFSILERPRLFLPFIANQLCQGNTGAKICAAILMYLVGPNYDNIDWKNLPIIGSHHPAGASIKQIAHFGQFVITGEFAEYESSNEIFVPSYKPKLYNISAISAPTAVFHGRNDWLVAPQDILRFTDQLPNLILRHLVKDQFFNHLDFIFGMNKFEMVEKYVIALLKKF